MKFAIAILVAVAAAGKSSRGNTKRKKPFWPNKSYSHNVAKVWWKCNFEGDQDAYCSKEELFAWWSEECYDAVDQQLDYDQFCNRATCESDPYGTRSVGVDDFTIGSTFDWAVDLADTVDSSDVATLGYALCDYMYDTFAADAEEEVVIPTLADETNVGLDELEAWYDEANAPAYWAANSLEWKPIDFSYDNFEAWAGYVYYAWAEEQESAEV